MFNFRDHPKAKVCTNHLRWLSCRLVCSVWHIWATYFLPPVLSVRPWSLCVQCASITSELCRHTSVCSRWTSHTCELLCFLPVCNTFNTRSKLRWTKSVWCYETLCECSRLRWAASWSVLMKHHARDEGCARCHVRETVRVCLSWIHWNIHKAAP